VNSNTKYETYCQAIIVAYNPNFDQLKNLVYSLEGQVGGVTIIDNASTGFDWDKFDSLRLPTLKVDLVKLDRNAGLGGGLNVGINLARQLKIPYVLLLDQDSLPDKEMVSNLHAAYEKLSANKNIAAVGPRFKDPLSGLTSQFKPTKTSVESNVSKVDFLITSGTYINTKVFEVVGMMNEGLFIDYVDAEWCFRAADLNLEIFGVNNALMIHSLGEKRKRLWFLRWRNISFHNPFRYYYIYRNYIILSCQSNIPIAWKVQYLIKLAGLFLVVGIFADEKVSSIKMVAKGVMDGFFGVEGRKWLNH
jgi:rhamnosyltransferase